MKKDATKRPDVKNSSYNWSPHYEKNVAWFKNYVYFYLLYFLSSIWRHRDTLLEIGNTCGNRWLRRLDTLLRDFFCSLESSKCPPKVAPEWLSRGANHRLRLYFRFPALRQDDTKLPESCEKKLRATKNIYVFYFVFVSPQLEEILAHCYKSETHAIIDSWMLWKMSWRALFCSLESSKCPHKVAQYIPSRWVRHQLPLLFPVSISALKCHKFGAILSKKYARYKNILKCICCIFLPSTLRHLDALPEIGNTSGNRLLASGGSLGTHFFGSLESAKLSAKCW